MMLSLTITLNNIINVIRFFLNISTVLIFAAFLAIAAIAVSYHKDVSNYRILFLLPIPIIFIVGVSTANLRYKLKMKKMLRAATIIRNRTIRDHIPDLLAIKQEINEYPLISKHATSNINCFSTYGKDAVIAASYFYYEFSRFLYLKYCMKESYSYSSHAMKFTTSLRYNHLHVPTIYSIETDTKIYDTQDLIL